MAAVDLTGNGANSSAGRALLRTRLLVGSAASAGKATLRVTRALEGRGANASAGKLSAGLISSIGTSAITTTSRIGLGAPVTILNATERQWREELSEAGFGSFVLMHDNASTASVDWLPNQLVDFYVGSTLAFTINVEQYEAHDIDPQEEAAQKTTYKGRGHVSLLDRVVLYPALGPYARPIEEDLAFNYVHPDYDDTQPQWVPATLIVTVLYGKVAWDSSIPEVQWDADFPDDTAEILWASDGTVTDAGVGVCYGRQPYTITTTGTFTLFAAADNYGEVYSDGVLMVSPGQSDDLEVGFTRMSKTSIELTAGEHLMAWSCTNGPGSGANPAGLAWALYEQDALGNTGALIAHSTAAETKIVEYASEPPGMTPGQVIILCLDTALERAGDPLVQAWRDGLTFDEFTSTDGAAWPVYPDQATKVGSGLYTFMRELSATYIDFSATPGTFELNAWTKGGRGGTNAATYTHAINLLSLKRTGES